MTGTAPKAKAGNMANGNNGNRGWWTPAVLMGIIILAASAAAFAINGVDSASCERTRALKDYVFREMELRSDGLNQRLDSIERKIDRILDGK